jgi:hypothetical protein
VARAYGRARAFFAITLVVFACKVEAGPEEAPSEGSDYSCSQFCGDQQSRGTLVGPLQDCVNQCCAASVARCGGADGSVEDGGATFDSGFDSSMPDTSSPKPDGLAPPPDAAADASPDASMEDAGDAGPCVTCNGACCPGGEQCILGACQIPCTTMTDCTSGCCAPATDANGDPVGPYVCKQNDASPYACCYGALNFCGTNYCCIADPQGNEFCSVACTSSSMCGDAQCNTYDFSHTSCSGTMACGPP